MFDISLQKLDDDYAIVETAARRDIVATVMVVEWPHRCIIVFTA